MTKIMDAIISILVFFGITADKYPFVALFVLLGTLTVAIGFWQNQKIDGLEVKFGAVLDDVRASAGKIKNNIIAIKTFLATKWPEDFNLSLMESMSPLRIKPKGLEILQQSGFVSVMENAEYRRKILSYISDQEPKTKLDVERNAIIYFPMLLEETFTRPISSYLYKFPTKREACMTLAALYVRDEYLKEHPEITE